MNRFEKIKNHSIKTKRYTWALIITWSVMVFASLIWNVYQERQEILDVALAATHVGYQKDVLYRRWNAEHGGVYVTVTEKMLPNPHLDVPERDIRTPSGRLLTLVNPAYMSRQVYEIAARERGIYGILGHITSLNPIRPENAPDPWETQALQAFQRGAKEVSSLEKIDGKGYMRMMHPFPTEKACLKCHAAHGAKEGDIRGGISVSLPMAPLRAIERSNRLVFTIGHGLLWLAGLVGIGFGARRLRHQDNERYRTEKALQESARLNELLLDSLPHPTLLVRRDRIVLAANRIAREVGTKIGEYCWQSFGKSEYIPDHHKQFIREHNGNIPPGGTKCTFCLADEMFAAHEPTNDPEVKSFGQLWDTWWVPIEDDKYLHYAINVTERKRAEEALRKAHDELEMQVKQRTAEITAANEQLKIKIEEQKHAEKALRESEQLFRTVADFTYDWESWIGTDGTYIYVSPSCERVTGYSADEFFKDHRLLEEIIHPDDRKSFSTHFHTHFHSNEAHSVDFRVIRRDGDTRKISHICQPVYDNDGNWLGRRVSNRDITEKEKLEGQLRQAQKMEAVGRLAGGVAHDFNNLLTAIIGNAHLMLKDLDKDSHLQEGLNEINESSHRAASLTRQLLAFSRKQILQTKVLNPNTLISDLKRMLGRLIGEDVILDTILEPDLSQVEADPGQLEQVIMNLVINAGDAIPQGGKITIETANVYLDEAFAREHDVDIKPGAYVMLSISDTGTGMDEETLAHIFEPFFTTKKEGKGTGFGLSTVYGIVKQTRGYIWAYSEPGKGTAFKVYLPGVAEEAETDPKTPVSLKRLRGAETVLVVEDDKSVRRLSQKVLQTYGYTVLEAQDGQEALSICKRHQDPIHLILTDVVMPKMSGRELIDLLKPLRPEIKVLYMSGYTDDTIVEHGILKPQVRFIQKPFSPENLVNKVREVLDSDP